MDIHINDLIIEKGFKDVLLKDVSFRDIDQEFIFVRSSNTFGDGKRNILFYCFIKPYQGLFFRKIGETNERRNQVIVDEDMNQIIDVPYSRIKNEIISKIVENGDLISNQLIVDIPFDYYDGNEELKDLMVTRSISGIDEFRLDGNPDCVRIEVNGIERELKLIRCTEDGIAAEDECGGRFLVKEWRE